MLTRAQFVEYLRDALNRLYDPDRLCKSPLADLFGVAGRADAYPALQRILVDAIASLEPQATTPSQLRAWRIYELLFYRYVQQHTVQMVADQLGVTMRHLRREQRAALETLAYRLWQQFDLDKKAGSTSLPESSQPAPAGPSVFEEIAWLQETRPEAPVDARRALLNVLELAKPLAAQHAVRLEAMVPAALPALMLHEVALNQILLNLLSVAIPLAGGGRVQVLARAVSWSVVYRIECARRRSAAAPGDDHSAGLDLAHHLAALCGGQLTVSLDEKSFYALLTVPTAEQLTVLAIDDNADTLLLLERYVAGTRYRLVGTRDAEQTFSMLERLSADIIVLDVMMPRVDGWRILSRLRQHPRTADLPIIVCTILPQESLALSLGASGFVRKPVTQQAFLAALDQQAELMARGPR
ncbi:MAG: response regulator [Anaerolineae bacterium]|nr:response regulator [Anaerolineae bacterium]